MWSHAAGQTPWGGVKDSGLGRTHGRAGLLECVNPKLLAWEPSRLRDAWWHPYDDTLGRALGSAVRVLYGREADRQAALRAGAPALVRLASRIARDALRR